MTYQRKIKIVWGQLSCAIGLIAWLFLNICTAHAQTIFNTTFESDTLGSRPSSGGTWTILPTSNTATVYATVSTLASTSSPNNQAIHFYDNDTSTQLSFNTVFTSSYTGTSAVKLTFDIYYNSILGASSGTQETLIRLGNSSGSNNSQGISAKVNSSGGLSLSAYSSPSGSATLSVGQWYTITLVAGAPNNNASYTYTVTVQDSLGTVIGTSTGISTSTNLADYSVLIISDTTGNTPAGIGDFYLDNISLTAIPEWPTVGSILVGFLFIAATMSPKYFQRNRKAPLTLAGHLKNA